MSHKESRMHAKMIPILKISIGVKCVHSWCSPGSFFPTCEVKTRKNRVISNETSKLPTLIVCQEYRVADDAASFIFKFISYPEWHRLTRKFHSTCADTLGSNIGFTIYIPLFFIFVSSWVVFLFFLSDTINGSVLSQRVSLIRRPVYFLHSNL